MDMGSEGGKRLVEACPACRASQIYSRMVTTPRYRCSQCGEEFAEPMRRPVGLGPSRGKEEGA